jgi:hypothetical protein
MPTTFRLQRTLLAACIILAPLSITLYILAWPENPAPVVVNATTPAPIVTSTMAGPTGNTLHFLGGIAASFFLPLGYLGMSLLSSSTSSAICSAPCSSASCWPGCASSPARLPGPSRSPVTMAYFAVHTLEVRYVLRYLICALWIIGAIPAALAMFKGDDLVEPTPRPA